MAVLNEKNVPYDIEYIDLSNKPDWFLEISPTGRVPVVQTPSGDVLFESAVINEYLDESHSPHFMPETPIGRAQERMWSDFVTGLYSDIFKVSYVAKNADEAQESIDSLKKRLGQLEEKVVGPLFNGEHFSLIDATAAPPFTRMDWTEKAVPGLDFFSATPKVEAWKNTLLSRPSIVNSVLPNLYDEFIERAGNRGSWIAA